MRTTSVVVVLSSVLVLLPGCARTSPPPQLSAAPREPPRPAAVNPTGAVDSISTTALRARQADDVAELLEGRVAGLQVIRDADGTISLRIRGMDSLNGAGDALVVLDGMPVEPRNLSLVLRELDPKDVQSIDVLKDVSSTSVYGMQGAHGVVVIRTKH